ncbi:MAG: hypothetical protein JRG91_17930, partial [Deltaproteobacteria bacterium]|nr:hypothetical protein [Deltaproteobacteria bacterium]
MARPIAHILLALALQGCYGSGGRGRSTPDGSTDPTSEDARTEDAITEDTLIDPAIDLVPDGWRFEDRDIPDRNIPVALLFAALPDIAYSGSSVGLVYHGMESGAGEAVGFIPLSSRGEV